MMRLQRCFCFCLCIPAAPFAIMRSNFVSWGSPGCFRFRSCARTPTIPAAPSAPGSLGDDAAAPFCIICTMGIRHCIICICCGVIPPPSWGGCIMVDLDQPFAWGAL